MTRTRLSKSRNFILLSILLLLGAATFRIIEKHDSSLVTEAAAQGRTDPPSTIQLPEDIGPVKARSVEEQDAQRSAGAASAPSPQKQRAVQSKPADTENGEQEGSEYLRKRDEWFYRQRMYPLGFIPVGARLKALEHRSQMEKSQQIVRSAAAISPVNPPVFPSPTTWTSIGPQAINNPDPSGSFIFDGTPSNVGRVASLAVDPTDSNTVYLGAASGGVWKSTDAGANWAPLTDTQASLAIGSIAIDPSSCSPAPCKVIYAGTGEAPFIDFNPSLGGSDYYGAGILKSADGGTTWTQVPAQFAGPLNGQVGGARIPSIAVHPTNPNVLLAGAVLTSSIGASSGVYRSADGGNTWTEIATASGAVPDAVFFDATSTGGNTAYAALGALYGTAQNGIYKSTDGGQTFAKLTGTGANLLPTAKVGRIELSIGSGAGGHLTLYASIADSSSGSMNFLGMFKSTDGGVNWIRVSAAPDVCSPQCFYSHEIRVSPADPNVVFAGGTVGNNPQGPASVQTLFRSTDGGTSWREVHIGASGTRLHVDQHAFRFSADGSRLYVGNDGGAWRSDNPIAAAGVIDWVGLNATLAITQFYPGLAVHPSDDNILFGGSQDNGSIKYSGNLLWNKTGCGDGAWNAVDNSVSSTVYLTCVSPNTPYIQKSFSNGDSETFFSVTNGINGADLSRTEFVPALVMDPANSQILYTPSFRVYQTTDGANNWNPISGDLTLNGTGAIATLAVAKSGSNTVYAGTDDGQIQRTVNAGAGAGATWTNLTKAPLPNRTITAIAVDWNDPNTAFVAYTAFSFGADTVGHLFKTTNGGGTWTDVSCHVANCATPAASDLPNIPVNDIVLDKDKPNTIYVATDVGVFFSSDGGATWGVLAPGLPHVPVLSLTARWASRTLRAGTHGRGAWLLQLTDFALPAFALASTSPATLNVGSPDFTTWELDGQGFTANTIIQWNNGGTISQIVPSAFTANKLTATIPAALLTSAAIVQVSLKDPVGGTTGSSPFVITFPVPTLGFLSPGNGTVGQSVALHFTGGAGYFNGTDVIFNGIDNTNSVASSGGTVLDVTIPGSELTLAATVHVQMSNPQPGGGISPFFFNFNIAAASGGAITTNPAFVNFGNQSVLNSSPVTNLTITNSGTASVTLGSATISGSNPGDFAVAAPTTGTPCNFGTTVLIVSASCTFGMQFTPSTKGARSATINLANNGTPNPQTLTVSGTGIGSGTSGDFDGDGKADIVVWRPSEGNWYIIPSNSPGTFTIQQWGANGDIPVRGDFDGDGKTDIAVWRPSNGTWFIIPSSNPSAPILQQWGAAGDIPVPGDYDGDGKTDFAVFRPSSGTWFIIPSSNPSAPILQQWGTAGDIPVPGDYDGDGKTDFAVFRPSNGTWFIIPSSHPSAPILQQWGTMGDMPVPGDYDGDGKTDIAVWRSSNGVWFIIPSSNPGAPIIQQWGATGDIPVPVDYDRDRKTDIAVWRPSNGVWYVIPSTANSSITVTQWGANGDVPVQRPIGQ